MTDIFDIAAMRQYENIFGPEKMRQLWYEYLDNAQKDLRDVEHKPHDELRLLYHSLRSSSLVFGMTAFAETCEKIEAAVIDGRPGNEIKLLIKEGQLRFAEAVKKVSSYFS